MDTLKKEKLNLETAASVLVDYGLQAGADSAEVCGSFGQRSRISLEKQDFHLASTDDGYLLGIRVLVGKSQGFCSINSLEKNELKEMAHRAVQIAKISPENPHCSLEAPLASKSSPSPLPLWDSSLANISLRTQKDWVQWMKNEILKDSRIRLNEGSLEVGKDLSLLINSRGVHQVEAETHCVWSLMAMAAQDQVLTSFDTCSHLLRTEKGLAEKILSTTKTFAQSLLKNLNLGTARNYRGLVLFSPRAVLDILIDSLMYHLNGRVVMEGSSRWHLTHKESEIVHSELHLTDTAWNPARFGCGAFDREGTPTQDLCLIDHGKLSSFLFDNYSAKGLHQSSTGHASGGPSSLPSVGAHSLSLAGGTLSLAKLLSQSDPSKQGVLWVNRYSGQTDPVTGDFSGVAKSSEWWVGGEFSHCVKETLISGNVFECLGKNLVALSKETQVVDDSNESPTLLADGVSVTTN